MYCEFFRPPEYGHASVLKSKPSSLENGVPMNWGGSLSGCPYNKVHSILVSLMGPLVFGNSQIPTDQKSPG